MYHTNDIRTTTYDRDMEIWIPKDNRGYSRGVVEAVWDVCRNDADDSVGAGSMRAGFV